MSSPVDVPYLTAAQMVAVDRAMTEDYRVDLMQMMENAGRNLAHLPRLIDGLLVHNQLEARFLQLHREPTDLRMVVTEALVTIDPLLLHKGHILKMDLAEPLPTWVDVHRLEQAVVSVLANAHEHTSPTTHITIRGWVVDNDVVVSVHDAGPGILDEELETIFEHFYQLSLSDGGSG
ncbi:MAG: HAMP domain-containing histidine kinase [Chloroflexota bacterium]|nr:HAMP domain-containing histidine kinase [Chloroflexota bacterium]